MTGRLRMAVAAAVATTLTASSLLPLVRSGAWIWQALGAVLLVAAVGEAVRRMSVPRPLIGVVQLVVLIPYLMLVLVPEVSGPIPTPDAVRAYGDLMSAGGTDIKNYSPPVPAADGIGAILVTVVAVVAVMVDTIAVTYGQAAPAGLPLLALYSVPAALAESGLGWGVFLLSGLAYVVLLLAEGRERLLRWGRPLVPPGARSSGTSARPWARGGGRIGLATLAVAVAVPAVIPMTANRLADRSGTGSDQITTINPVVDLKDELNRPENTDLLTYTTTADPRSMYLRIAALDLFDGNSWQPSEQGLVDPPKVMPPPQGLDPSVKATKVTTEIKVVKGYKQGSVPMPYPASEVKVKGDWRYENEGRLLLGDKGQTISNQRYTVVSLDVRPTADQLRAAGAVPSSMSRYRPVPLNLVRSLTDVTNRVAGSGSSFDKALRLEKWFAESGDFKYDTKVPNKGNGKNAIDNFMEQKIGYCEQFASTMAVMARILGIPSRVAVGFVPGSPTGDGTYKIGSHDAHAWPELYFANVGWVRFEPTPSRGTAPQFDDNRPLPEPSSSLTATPTETNPTPLPEQSRQCRMDDCPEDTPTAAAVAAGGGGDGGNLRNLLIGVGAAVLVVLLLALPMLLRRRVRRRRLTALSRDPVVDAGRADPGEAVLGAWQEVLDTARDLGIRTGNSETPRQLTVRLLAELPEDAEAAREALPRIALAAEQVMYAPEAPQRTIGLAEDVRAVRGALLAAATRGTRLRAEFLPASAFRRPQGGPLERLRSGREPEPEPGSA
ncbi:transglutaminase TgpA family protein [Yinghuangia soli]|uniref:DUF3488 and transglutaminase-like domain-containing protein n=1 Tax=Yinghuangia soli TaxID=2908204 RepID=A0AA41Q4Y3_9ACTN|nr:DUF3488 and transglutaminase-like domain-containing protein [Yinghuangia soli]MCF2531292.1 DUF3488 and transglutaminase-like domain-containing protein [Yinghuangia soli]